MTPMFVHLDNVHNFGAQLSHSFVNLGLLTLAVQKVTGSLVMQQLTQPSVCLALAGFSQLRFLA